MKTTKKGQSALEFLMTYGWAFLIILIMIGSLAYFGVLDPSKLLPDRVTFTPPIQVKRGEYVMFNEVQKTVAVNLINSFGSNIKVINGSAKTDYMGGCNNAELYLDVNNDGVLDASEQINTPGASISWKEGDSYILYINCDTGDNLPEESKVKFTINLKWHPGGSQPVFAKSAQGMLLATVQ